MEPPLRFIAPCGAAALLLVATAEVRASSGSLLGDPLFLDGFETAECHLWSATSEPIGAPDADEDTYGDLTQPTVYCQLPAGSVPNALDCDDADADVHPGAAEVCNLVDDDCSAATPDGSQDADIGEACDGTTDTDFCTEGLSVCVNGQIACDDLTGSTVDLCNGGDDDCDPGSPDGSEDPLDGQACDGEVDTDFCLEGTNSCSDGSLACSDSTGSTVELCAGDAQDENCDGQVDEGFPRNTNPLCLSTVVGLGEVSGDTGNEPLTFSGHDERWLSFTISEDSDFDVYLSAMVSLQSPVGADFDLYLYCASCGGFLGDSSIVSGEMGHTDQVQPRWGDDWGEEDTYDVVIEVRHVSSSRCASWNLTILGNASLDGFPNTCDP